MPPPPKRLLLVEGKDDLFVVSNLLEENRVPQVFSIKELGGIDPLLEDLPTRLKAQNEERLGVLIDADESLESRWRSVKNILTTAGYKTVPEAPDAAGTILREEDLPIFGAWLMPDNRASGMLEDFMRYLVPADDTLWKRAEACIASIPEDEKRFGVHRTKAQLHTWLAWQEEPGSPMGLAITKRYLDPNTVEARAFIQWLERLFVEESSP